MAVSERDLVSKFGSAINQQDVITEALSVCKAHSLSAEELSYKWDAFVFNHQTAAESRTQGAQSTPNKNIELNIDNLRLLRKEIQSTTSRNPQNEPSSVARNSNIYTPAGMTAKGSRKSHYSRGIGLDNLLNSPSPSLSRKKSLQSDIDPSSTPRRNPVQTGSPAIRNFNNATPTGKSSSNTDTFSSPNVVNNLSERQNPFQTVESLNGHLSTSSPVESHESKISFKYVNSKDKSRFDYRYMFETMAHRAAVMDDVIERIGRLICEYHGIDENELGDPSIVSTETIPAIGRICQETDGVKINDVATWLETSRIIGAGDRVLLSFEDGCIIRKGAAEGGFSLFPGMIVGVRGRNAGNYFSVNEILLPPPIDTMESPNSQLLKYQYSHDTLNGNPLSIMVASGPYTFDSNLEFEPYHVLLEEIVSSKPHYVILLGPFVDANHKQLKVGDLDTNPANILREKILSPLSTLLSECPGTTAIIVPSTRDITNPHDAYPQSAFDSSITRSTSGARTIDTSKIKFVSNPSFFKINEISFAITNTDTLFHIRAQELFKQATEMDQDDEVIGQGDIASDVVSRSCRHLLRQRNLYPVFPTPIGPQFDFLNLDVSHLHLAMLEQPVDIVITPSQLGKHFARIVDSVVFVNPGFAARKDQPGSFSRLAIHPISRQELQANNGTANVDMNNLGEDHMTENRTWERCRVDIVKI